MVVNHDHELVVKLNAAMRQGRYSADVWQECTGLSVQELWSEYVASLARALTPASGGGAPGANTGN